MTQLELMLTRWFLNIFYLFFRSLPVDKRKVLFATPRNDALEGNLHAIHRTMKGLHPEYKAVFLLDTYGYSFKEKLIYLLKLIRGLYHVQTSAFVILDNAYLPVHLFKHKEATTVIQTWHASGAFKKFGRSTIGLPDGIKSPETHFLHKYYDYAICTAQRVVPCYSEAFGLPPSRVLPLGAPRTDFFFNDRAMEKQRQKVFKDFPHIQGKRVLLYAPTFRGRGRERHSRFPMEPIPLLAGLGEDTVLMIKPHPHTPMTGIETSSPQLVLVPDDYPLHALLTAVDVLITDYSSVIFEFALLGKPMVFFAHDLKEYRVNSAFYWDYRAFVPGPIATTQGELVRILQEEAWKDFDTTAFAHEYFDHLDGMATRRFVQHFFS